jgi:hypothetical protein
MRERKEGGRGADARKERRTTYHFFLVTSVFLAVEIEITN